MLGGAIIVWGVMTGNLLALFGLIPLLTGSLGFCPIYLMLEMNTGCKKEESGKTKDKVFTGFLLAIILLSWILVALVIQYIRIS